MGKATFGVRSLRPIYKCCRLDFHVLIPVFTIGLFLFQIIATFKTPYLPEEFRSIEILGWTLFGCCCACLFVGIQNFTSDGSLEPIPDDYPYNGTVEERKEYWENYDYDNNEDNHNHDDVIGETDLPSSSTTNNGGVGDQYDEEEDEVSM